MKLHVSFTILFPNRVCISFFPIHACYHLKALNNAFIISNLPFLQQMESVPILAWQVPHLGQWLDDAPEVCPSVCSVIQIWRLPQAVGEDWILLAHSVLSFSDGVMLGERHWWMGFVCFACRESGIQVDSAAHQHISHHKTAVLLLSCINAGTISVQ